jgi:hypothetical protein
MKRVLASAATVLLAWTIAVWAHRLYDGADTNMSVEKLHAVWYLDAHLHTLDWRVL